MLIAVGHSPPPFYISVADCWCCQIEHAQIIIMIGSASLAVLLLLVLAAAAALAYRHRRLLRYAYQFACMQLSMRLFLLRRWTTCDMFAARVAATPNNIAFIQVDAEAAANSQSSGNDNGNTSVTMSPQPLVSMTFAQLDRLSSRVACWSRDQGLSQGEVVALLMDNSARYVATWLGLAKIGAAAALINTNLRQQALIHCIRTCEARMIVAGDEYREAIESIRPMLPSDVKIWYHTEYSAALESYPDLSYDWRRARQGLGPSDLLFYIFTSGTTGLPKAAKIKHARFYLSGTSFVNFFGIHERDRIYCPLPLYHSAGGMIGISCAFYTGASVILRRKFSARSFFLDCSRASATIVQYIGQIARYLLSTPPSTADRDHQVRVAMGNGMPAEIWTQFQSRFHIPEIAEFYASTEGNANLINNFNKPGVVGWIPPIAKLIYPVRLVSFDPVTEKPVRDPRTGRCIECGVGETGELVARIDSHDPLRSFDGYTSMKDTEEKVLKGVFKEGDRWFRSGDLLRADEEGFLYFVDRVGDTFRWKGENVATTEVQAIMSHFQPRQLSASKGLVNMKDINVYGVSVQGNDGRAGMACITLERQGSDHGMEDDQGTTTPVSESDFDMDGLFSYLQSQLPPYQNPLFLRFQQQMDMTGTFKHKKADLVREGFDPSIISDALYFRHDAQRRYVRIDPQLYEAIQQGRIRV